MKLPINEISWALEMLHDGLRVRREGWSGKHLYLRYVQGGETVLAGSKNVVMMLPHVLMWTGEGYTPWLCSQSDLFADDWVIV